MAEINWMKIKSEYATTDISYRKLADKHCVSFNTLKGHASKERWTEARKTYKEKLTKSTLQKVADKNASACAAQLIRLRDATDTATLMVEQMMADQEQFKRHIVTEGLGMGATRVEERKYDKYDTKALKDFTSSLRDLAYVIRNVFDLPTVQEQTAMDIAIKRLELEEKKAEADTAVDEITVEFDEKLEGMAE
ncbi:MAG: hypothetical protein ACOX8Q_01785 [Christensenellales bacterium]|jgi:hypothetical protein